MTSFRRLSERAAPSFAADPSRPSGHGVTAHAGGDLPPRTLGLATATALVVSEVIGVGIFLTPAGMVKTLGSPLLLLAVWLLMLVNALAGALCYAELAARFPADGGMYVYLREAFGPRLAFVYGWQCLLVTDPGLTAALAAGVAAHAAIVAPGLPEKAVAVATVLLVALSNAAGIRLAGAVARFLAVLKVVLLLALVAWGLASPLGDPQRFVPLLAQHPGSLPLLPALGAAVVSAFFSCGGWWDVNRLAGEIRDPQRSLPRALALGLAVAGVVYLGTTAAFIYLVPLASVDSGETFAAQLGAVLFGARGGQALALLVILCVGSSLLAFMTAAPRVYYAMGRDGIALPALAVLDPRSGAPLRAIALQAVLACLLLLLGRFDDIIGYFVFAVVAFLATSVVGLFRQRRRQPTASYMTPWFPWTGWVFLATTALVLALVMMRNPLQASLGLLVTALGLPVYGWLRRRAGRPAAS